MKKKQNKLQNCKHIRRAIFTPGRRMKTTAVVFIRREVRRKARNLINRFKGEVGVFHSP